jgi:hypothetical protein
VGVRIQTQAIEQFTPGSRDATLPVAMSTFLLVLGGLVTTPAISSDLLRCGSKVISEGDSPEKVRTSCGTPEDIVPAAILRRPSYVRQGRITYFGDQLIQVQVETWTYNFGPQRLMHRLRFVDGTLETIETLGYGHHPVGTTDR